MTNTTQREADERDEALRNVLEMARQSLRMGRNEKARGHVGHAIFLLTRAPAAATDQPSAGQVDERALLSIFERDAKAHLGRPMVAYAPGFQKDDDGGYQYAATRSLFAFWKAARASLTPTAPAEQDRRALELANAALIAAQPRDITPKGWERHEAAINATGCALHKPVVTPTAPQAASASDAQECLKDLISHHGDFHTACTVARDLHKRNGDSDSTSYWDKQLHVLARMKVQAERALAPQAASPAEPMYQAQFDGERGSSVWHDVTEAAYHTFMPEHRRIVYAAPQAASQQAEPVATITGSDTVIGRESRGLQWVKGVSAFDYEPGTKLYAASQAATTASASDVDRALSDLADEAHGNGNSMEWVNEQVATIRAALARAPLPGGRDA